MQTKLEKMLRFERDSRTMRNLQAHIIEGYERARCPSSLRLGHDNILSAKLGVAVMSAKMGCFVSSNPISLELELLAMAGLSIQATWKL
jgi:hypothetical protein